MEQLSFNREFDPRRYFESVDARRQVPQQMPVCLYLETTNRCNLLCTTCPRTYAELEPPADMSWELFTSIVDQIPGLQRAVLHGVGEPMLVKHLPRMVSYLKERNVYVLFNTNGTVLNERNGRALIEAGLDELRVSLDAANARTYREIRGKNYFSRILKNVRAFRDLQEREQSVPFVEPADQRVRRKQIIGHGTDRRALEPPFRVTVGVAFIGRLQIGGRAVVRGAVGERRQHACFLDGCCDRRRGEEAVEDAAADCRQLCPAIRD